MAAFDAAAYKTTTEAQWDTVAQHWNAWGLLLDRWLGPATEQLLDMARVGPGSRVLHVAGGAGQDALQSAARVGPRGHVLSTDVSANLTAIAARNFVAAGHGHARAERMDGEDLDVPPGSFDAVLSRVGIIFMPDQDRAMAQHVAALKPGGYAGALVYATPGECRFFSDPVGIIRRHADLPPPAPGMPGPFSLGGEGVVEALLERAGLTEIERRKIEAPVRLPTAADCLRFQQESFAALHQMLEKLDDAGRRAAWDEVAQALAAFEGPDGFVGPCVMIAAVGRKPA